MHTKNEPITNARDARDLLLDEPNGFVRASAVRTMLERGVPAVAIFAEVPGVSEREIRDAMIALGLARVA